MAQKTLKSFGDRVRWHLLPLYVLTAGVVAWAGALTMLLFAEAGAPEAAINEISLLSGSLAVFAVLIPFINPALTIAMERLLDRWRDREEVSE